MTNRYVLMMHVDEHSMYDNVVLGVFDTLEDVSKIKDEQFRGNNDVSIIKLDANKLYLMDYVHEMCYTPLELERKEKEERKRAEKIKEQAEFNKWVLEKKQKELLRMKQRSEMMRNEIGEIGKIVFSTAVRDEVLEHVLDCYDELSCAHELRRTATEFNANKENAHRKRMKWFSSRMDKMIEVIKNENDIEAFNRFRKHFDEFLLHNINETHTL